MYSVTQGRDAYSRRAHVDEFSWQSPEAALITTPTPTLILSFSPPQTSIQYTTLSSSIVSWFLLKKNLTNLFSFLVNIDVATNSEDDHISVHPTAIVHPNAHLGQVCFYPLPLSVINVIIVLIHWFTAELDWNHLHFLNFNFYVDFGFCSGCVNWPILYSWVIGKHWKWL